MRDKKAELDARYHVVTLIYRGKLEEAEIALKAFCQDGTLSSDYADFYQLILSEAKNQSVGAATAPDSPFFKKHEFSRPL